MNRSGPLLNNSLAVGLLVLFVLVLFVLILLFILLRRRNRPSFWPALLLRRFGPRFRPILRRRCGSGLLPLCRRLYRLCGRWRVGPRFRRMILVSLLRTSIRRYRSLIRPFGLLRCGPWLSTWVSRGWLIRIPLLLVGIRRHRSLIRP